jgi:hypothetical protein
MLDTPLATVHAKLLRVLVWQPKWWDDVNGSSCVSGSRQSVGVGPGQSKDNEVL